MRDYTRKSLDIEVKNKLDKNGDSQGKMETVDYDTLLSSAGEFGLYQWFLFVATMPFYWFGVFTYFGQMFITAVSPNHWCRIPELENLTALERRNLAIPMDDYSKCGYSQCRQYVANWSEVLVYGLKPDPTWPTEKCQNGWEFNSTEIPYATISSEMEWVCEKDMFPATAQSLYFVGSIIGGFLVGWVADRFGRIPAAVFSNMIGCIAGVVSVFVTNFVQFAVCRFFVGMAYDNCMMMTCLLVLEYVAPKYRTLIANLPFAVFFTTALCAIPWIALACGYWKTIALATSIPMALSLLAPFIMPESPRWLLSKNRVDDAIAKIVKIGKVNKKEVPSKLIEKFKKTCVLDVEQKSSLKDVLLRPRLRYMFICTCLNYMSCMLVFDALVRTLESLQFDFFLSFTVVSLTEFPSLVILSFIADLTGRKWLSIVSFSVCFIFMILTLFVGPGLPSVLCSVAARFAANMACNTAMQWAAEVLPTPVRGSGVSAVHICGYVATVISPFIAYSEVIAEWLPAMIIAGVSAFGALICLGLPEMANKQMPQTFQDAEEMVITMKVLERPPGKVKVAATSGYVNDSFEMN